MAAKFSLFRPRCRLPSATLYPPPQLRFIAAVSCSGNAALSFSYGPSLHKGHSPLPLQLPKCPSSAENFTSLDEAAFTRIFDISALRVPSAICSTLESRLRGHLLNWPRVRNIARVPGDEIDEEIRSILPQSAGGGLGEDEALVALNRRVYGRAEGDGEPLNAVLYRDKLARSFNSLGYARFRNLAKISRSKNGKIRDGGEKRVVKGVRRSEAVLVEVVELCDGDDLSGLLGEDAPRQQMWRGPTRLLLLDERHSGKSIEELPQAIKVLVLIPV